jgi:hypothetical protein
MTEDDRRKPTKAQLDFLNELRAAADDDADYWLDKRPEEMTRHAVQEEIDRLMYQIGRG